MNYIKLTEDGYIENQSICNLKLGDYKTNYNGCGWIALYNYINKCYPPTSLEETAISMCSDFDNIVLFKGKFGLFPNQIAKIGKYYGAKNLRYKLVSKKSQKDLGENGIIFYWVGKSAHYVMYERKSKQSYTFHNVGNRQIICSMEEFENKFIKLGAYIVIKEW